MLSMPTNTKQQLCIKPTGFLVVSGTFELFNVKCKQHNMTALNPFLNGTKNGHVDGTCKATLSICKY